MPESTSRGPKRIVRGLVHRVRRVLGTAQTGAVSEDLIHAIKNDIVSEVGGVKHLLHVAGSAQQGLVDQQAVTGARVERALAELEAARDEIGFVRNDVLAALDAMAPHARARKLHDLRLADVDEPTAGFLNYAGSHRGPLADVGLWRNDPVVVEWLAGTARVGAVNERIVEQPFVHGALAGLAAGSRILDVGGGESLVGLAQASLGHDVTVLEPAGYPYEHPNLTVRTETLEAHEPAGPVDAVVLLSAIEHFGIGAYANNGELDEDADLAATARVRDLLAPGGLLVLTTPFGPAAVDDLERTYDAERLGRLLDGYDVERVQVATRADATTWTVSASLDGLDGLTTPGERGHVAMVVARRPAG